MPRLVPRLPDGREGRREQADGPEWNLQQVRLRYPAGVGRLFTKGAVMRLLRGLPPGALWIFAAAALFLLGAANASWHGLGQMTQIGVCGAIGALVVAAVCCDWQRPRLPGRS